MVFVRLDLVLSRWNWKPIRYYYFEKSCRASLRFASLVNLNPSRDSLSKISEASFIGVEKRKLMKQESKTYIELSINSGAERTFSCLRCAAAMDDRHCGTCLTRLVLYAPNVLLVIGCFFLSRRHLTEPFSFSGDDSAGS